MVISRAWHSSCILGTNLFVVGGISQKNEPVARVNFVQVSGYAQGKIGYWQNAGFFLKLQYRQPVLCSFGHE